MISRACIIVLTLATVLSAVGLRAQDTPQPPGTPSEPTARPTGMPSAVVWTFNFNAGWGTFGFANSLYNNTHDPGVPENLSDQWFEGYVKPSLSWSHTLRSSSEIYGTLSAVGERTYGSMPPAFGDDVSSFGPEDLSIGWRSGKTLAIGDNAIDLSIGRSPYELGHGFLVYDGASEGGSRGGYWTNARKAFELSAVARFQPGPHKVEGFYLDRDELPENDTGSRLWGVNYEFSTGLDDSTTIGATYMKWAAHRDRAPGRDGLDVLNLRTYTAPVRSAPDLTFEIRVRVGTERRRCHRTGGEIERVDRSGRVPVQLRAMEAEDLLPLRGLPGGRPRYRGKRGVRSAVSRLLGLGLVVAG